MSTSSSAASAREPHDTKCTSPFGPKDTSTPDTRSEIPPTHEESQHRLPQSTSASTSTSANSGTSFLDLPAEMRNVIYEYAVVQDEPIRFTIEKAGAARQPDLSRVNRQIRSECLPILYGQNKFAIADAYTFLRQLTMENRMVVRYLYLDLPWCNINDAEDCLKTAAELLENKTFGGVTRSVKTALVVGKLDREEVRVDLQEISQYEEVELYRIEKKKEGAF